MSLPTIAAFKKSHGPLTPAETALLTACKAGEECVLGDGELPPEGKPDPKREVRAALLRLLILGGNEADGLHPKGVWVEGAHVTGELDLSFQKARGRCGLLKCRLEKRPNFIQTSFGLLGLDDSTLPGLLAQGAVVTGNLFLRRIKTSGTLDLKAAKVGGQVDCERATLNGNGSNALNAQGLECGQSLILSGIKASGTLQVNGVKVGGQVDCFGAMLDGKGPLALSAQGLVCGQSLFLRAVNASGTVALNGAKIGGQVTCEGATLDGNGGMALNAQEMDCGQSLFLRGIKATGTVALNGAKVGGQVECAWAILDGNGGRALNGQRLEVMHGLLFRNVKSVVGQVYLASAYVADLVDDVYSWPSAEDEFFLDGCTYERIAGRSPITLADRKDWLARGSRFQGRFFPQPYTQFAKVLREAGNAGEARKVLAERDRLVFQEVHRANRTALDIAQQGQGDVGRAWLRLQLTQVWDWFTRVFSGYGHAPHYALFWSLGLVALGAVWFFMAWQAGVMVPNSPVIMTSDEWRSAVKANPLAPSHDWVAKAAAATHYETFYSLPFALDTYAPLVSLGQEEAWAATTTTTFGWLTRWFTFGFKIAGWAISALGLAAITGFVQKNQPD